MRVQSIQDYFVQDPATFNHPKNDLTLSKGQNILIGALFPVWVPVAFVAGILGLSVLSVIAVKSAVQAKEIKQAYKKDKQSYMAGKAEEFLRHFINQSCQDFFSEQFREIRWSLKLQR